MSNITIKTVLQDNTLSDGMHYVALRITKNRKKTEISLGMKCRPEDFSNQEFNKTYPSYRSFNDELLKLKGKAMQIVDDFESDMYDFTLEEFKAKFKNAPKYQNSSIIKFIDEIIDEMLRSGRTGNAKAYDETKKAILRFAGKQISFKAITPTFLEKFEVFLRENGNENGGIGFKMRELRAVFNKAINRSIISQENYPFKFYKVSKLKAQKNKRALSAAELRRIRDLDLNENHHLLDAHNFFMFSFYSRGINFVDMMKLKWSDLQDGRIRYIRSKTKVSFSLEIMDNALKIIEYYRQQDRPTKYVFPILLNNDMTPIQVEYRKKKVLQQYNKHLKEIATLAKIEKRLTSYVARHSFATILKQKGTSTDKISELMGHADVNITKTYLKEFDNEELDIENRKLLDL